LTQIGVCHYLVFKEQVEYILDLEQNDINLFICCLPSKEESVL